MSSTSNLILDLLEHAVLPSALFILTTCVISLWIGVLVGSYLKRQKHVTTSLKIDPTTSTIISDNIMSKNESLNRPIKVPKHIAVIMDGNRRFGREKHSDLLQGHWAGGQRLIDFVQWCMEDGIQILTVYAFSTENWNRDPLEVSALMNIFVKHSQTLKTEALAKHIRVKVLSTATAKLPDNVKQAIYELETATAQLDGFQLNVCLSYGSRAEIAASCRRIAVDLCNHVIEDEASIDEDLLSKYMMTADTPDPDILIRTSGEYRLSNFLLYQMAYTEMFFINKYWPEISQHDLREILHRFAARDRRFGG